MEEDVKKRTREQERARSRRLRPVRAITLPLSRETQRNRRRLRLEYPEADTVHDARPRVRAECEGGPRPCPYVSCRHHLYLDASEHTENLKLNFPDLEVWELAHSCSLDVADDGPRTLEQVGELLNMTRERVRQIENEGKAWMERRLVRAVGDLFDDGRLHLRVLREAVGEIPAPAEIDQ